MWTVPPPHCGIFSHNCCASIALGRENLARESYWVRLSPCTTITAKVHLTPNCSSGAVKWLTVQDCAALSSSLVWMCVIAWMWSRVLFWKKKKYLGVSQLQGPLSCQIFHPLALLIKCEICLFAFFFFNYNTYEASVVHSVPITRTSFLAVSAVEFVAAIMKGLLFFFFFLHKHLWESFYKSADVLMMSCSVIVLSIVFSPSVCGDDQQQADWVGHLHCWWLQDGLVWGAPQVLLPSRPSVCCG